MGAKLDKYIKDPGSSITHLIGLILALGGMIPLLIRASKVDSLSLLAVTIYVISLILLYAASTTYHTFDRSERINRILKKCDHMMICVLIAGTYTPVCLIVLRGRLGYIMLAIIWCFALVGIILKAFWVYCPKWVSSVLYIGMGWTCVLAFAPLIKALDTSSFIWLLAGGIIYTIGGIIYALKLSIFNSKHQYFGSHEIFHLFVMAGSICHYIFVWKIL
ncbi:hemolysin III [Lachnospiraceae bacterium PM6-15]|uniref:Hemolysin III family protein n=1 Tax=Ohessyouella blattaphilus TaxID=2949333 RepID=A0ABT1EL71_9FIRM|nr:hemolysin III family protein [Ohessyouella blattaphilus]MCP1110012.1 hemolysin III family protein [Ohessyouella blattaphilus]MCR8563406.1 hemolysin III family protein [Ohessyouella blattaphilus]